jgi:hypothetical protein
VSVRVEVAMSDSAQAGLDPSGQWNITYQITGDESGPIIGTFNIYGDGQYDVNEEFLPTRSSNTPITIKGDIDRQLLLGTRGSPPAREGGVGVQLVEDGDSRAKRALRSLSTA